MTMHYVLINYLVMVMMVMMVVLIVVLMICCNSRRNCSLCYHNFLSGYLLLVLIAKNCYVLNVTLWVMLRHKILVLLCRGPRLIWNLIWLGCSNLNILMDLTCNILDILRSLTYINLNMRPLLLNLWAKVYCDVMMLLRLRGSHILTILI